MSTFRFLSILLFVGLGSFHLSFSQESTKGTVYLLRVESTDPADAHVRFSYAYAPEDSLPLVMGEQETPFEKKFSGTHFLGMFKDISGSNNIEVSLVLFNNGAKFAEVKGYGALNVLHADSTRVGYGTSPMGRLTSLDLEHRFDIRESKKK